MSEGAVWKAAPENTLESLRHAFTMFDGVEFDIRLTADEQLIIHHDRTVSVPKEFLKGRSAWLEEWNLDELVDLGFLSFEAFLDDPLVLNSWRDEGSMGCIEIKRPHPTSATGGGFLGRKKHNEHIAKVMKLAEAALDERQIPKENTVFYAFHRGMPASARQAKTKRPWAALIPYIPPYGNRTTQRMQVFPKYLTTSFRRLVKQHRAQGSAMLPCAIEYFENPTRHLPLGRHVGLTGPALHRLTNARKGMPTYVWPTKPDIEHHLLRAGMSALTDYADPELTWLPSGHARWRQPALRPLLESEWSTLQNATHEQHREVVKELEEQVPRWSECDSARRRTLIGEWSKRWKWEEDIEGTLTRFQNATPPASAPKMIGHRGSGKTSRPVLNPHSM